MAYHARVEYLSKSEFMDGERMSYKYLTNIQLEKAREDYIELLIGNGFSSSSEIIPVAKAAGRVTSEAVYARICAPHYNACAMDGIALDAKLTFGASETTPVILTSSQYVNVDTGDPLPDGCDAVVMIEDVIKVADDGESDVDSNVDTSGLNDMGVIKLFDAIAPYRNIRQIGEDVCAGEMLLSSFSKITPSALGAMIAGGVTTISVVRKPVVGIIPTGDEIVPPTTNPAEGEILEFNSTIFSSMLCERGADTITYPIVEDDFLKIRSTAQKALEECDIVLIGAGSSAGREDYSASVIADVGEVLYHGIAIKPGKPTILGHALIDSSVKPILGIPGYPVSGIIVIEQLLYPLIDYLTHNTMTQSTYVNATLSKVIDSSLKYREFMRVRLGYVGDKLIASPLGRGSGVVTSFMRADGILEIPQGVEGYKSGVNVNVRLLRSEAELKNSIVCIGSHDPLLDELSDLLRINFGDISMGSAHVGSMGGILAVKKGEAHIAGTHLLDENTGEYNKSFVKRLVPNGGVRLVECVKRKQGLILPKGNPKNISSIADLLKDGVRFVNRQKGSGTRVLMDFLCKQDGVDSADIYGYDREEFTHTSIAALIASGSADVGLGVYSAANLYELDFVPIYDEQYDLLIPDHAFELDFMQKLLETLTSESFRKRVEALGGYGISTPGRVIDS